MPPFTFDWGFFQLAATRIGVAYLLVLPTGLMRERQAHGIGVRTFPIVAIASCGYLMIMQGPGSGPDTVTANSRVLQGLLTGIGFVGGGAILKDGMSVHGTATAASIWNTGAIGAAAALGRFEIALILAILNLFTMYALAPLKKRLDQDDGYGDGKVHDPAELS